MRIALLSDLHANALALRAVFADLEKSGVDQVVCLGDVATLGPEPHEVLAMLRQHKVPCILGNHDEFLLVPELIHRYTEAPIIVSAIDHCRAELSSQELAFLHSFRRSLELQLSAHASLFLFHGSPRSHMEDLLATTPPDELDERLCSHRATVMAGGHTHIQMLRQHRGVLLVNPGSVGLPFQEYVAGGPPTVLSHAEYAIVSAEHDMVSVDLRRVPLSRSALREAAAAWKNPLRDHLVQQYADPTSPAA
jgi:putative phosphoesterase